jgi:uncharacterized protein YcnI
MNRQIAAAALSFVVLSAASMRAHVVVTPRESAAGAEQVYTVRVPAEGTVSSISLELEIPEGLDVMQIASGEDFTFDARKEKDQIVSITWKREIKPKAFALFTFTARNPSQGVLKWNAHQTFADGSRRHWIGERGTKEPASITTILSKGQATTAPADPTHTH